MWCTLCWAIFMLQRMSASIWKCSVYKTMLRRMCVHCTLLAWIHPFLQIILTMFILFFESSKCKSASMARNWINSVPQTAATTFAFSFVFILLLRCVHPPDKILEVDACPLGLVLQPLGHSRQDIGTFYRQKEGQTSCSLFELCSMFLDVFVVF